MLWDLFCRVIDNWGDIGVCWRLAVDLRARGHRVRLWVDDPRALQWMAPDAPDVAHWDEDTVWPEPGDVVIEAFGCDPPADFVARMAAGANPPLWINLEYLSAEPAALRNHGLRSPQQGVAQGLRKYFFYPGWLESSGGLLREASLGSRQAQFDPEAWWGKQGLALCENERRVSLFCYRNPALPRLLCRLQEQPTCLLVTAGQATEQVRAILGDRTEVGGLRVRYLPPLSQIDFDHLLWVCDVNFVRGEDSFVRAQWADRPFIWQAYPQSDDAHHAKLRAYLQLQEEQVGLCPAQHALSLAWNGLSDPTAPLPWPSEASEWQAWQTLSQSWGAWLRNQTDLSTRLVDFANSHRPTAPR